LALKIGVKVNRQDAEQGLIELLRDELEQKKQSKENLGKKILELIYRMDYNIVYSIS